MKNKVKEINNNVSIYLQLDESKMEVLDKNQVKDKSSNKIENCGDLAHAFLEELIESNPALAKKYGIDEVIFYVQESETQEVDC